MAIRPCRAVVSRHRRPASTTLETSRGCSRCIRSSRRRRRGRGRVPGGERPRSAVADVVGPLPLGRLLQRLRSVGGEPMGEAHESGGQVRGTGCAGDPQALHLFRSEALRPAACRSDLVRLTRKQERSRSVSSPPVALSPSTPGPSEKGKADRRGRGRPCSAKVRSERSRSSPTREAVGRPRRTGRSSAFPRWCGYASTPPPMAYRTRANSPPGPQCSPSLVPGPKGRAGRRDAAAPTV